MVKHSSSCLRTMNKYFGNFLQKITFFLKTLAYLTVHNARKWPYLNIAQSSQKTSITRNDKLRYDNKNLFFFNRWELLKYDIWHWLSRSKKKTSSTNFLYWHTIPKHVFPISLDLFVWWKLWLYLCIAFL